MSLKAYKQKRDFKRTREPAGGKRTQKQSKQPLFVIQKHAASHLHYDFRLEMEGVLKSWAVPKGLPMKKGERHLAVQVEDHPFDYAGFEGTIAPGNYGAGTVMVWDTGTYRVEGDDPLGGLKSGKLHMTLAGKKLKGDWALVRMRPRDGDGDKPQWLIFKSGEDALELSAHAENQSAVSRKTMEQIASGGSPEWKSNRPASSARRVRPIKSEHPEKNPDLTRLPRAKPKFVEPMKCLLVEDLPKGDDWLYEIKFDGVRALAIKSPGGNSLISRNRKDLSAKYSEVMDALKNLPATEVLIDGEVVAVDKEGRSSFQLLQARQMPGGEKPPLLYYAFDLLNLDGHDLTGLPLVWRKELLKSLVEAVPETVLFSAGIQADTARVVKAMKARGLEGVVGKKKDSKYETGRRSGAWVKFKWTLEQEFVIGGYTPPKGSRSHFGAILVGFYEKGRLLFASKVGSGFDQKLLGALNQQFQKLRRADCPFANLPEKRPVSGRGGLLPSEFRRCAWIEPKLVCQIRFSEWTRDGHLRQPVFLGLREDKKAREVVREIPK